MPSYEKVHDSIGTLKLMEPGTLVLTNPFVNHNHLVMSSRSDADQRALGYLILLYLACRRKRASKACVLLLRLT